MPGLGATSGAEIHCEPQSGDIRRFVLKASTLNNHQTLPSVDVTNGGGRWRTVDHWIRRWSEIPLSGTLTVGDGRASREQTVSSISPWS